MKSFYRHWYGTPAVGNSQTPASETGEHSDELVPLDKLREMFKDLDEAVRLTKDRPDCQARVDSLAHVFALSRAAPSKPPMPVPKAPNRSGCGVRARSWAPGARSKRTSIVFRSGITSHTAPGKNQRQAELVEECGDRVLHAQRLVTSEPDIGIVGLQHETLGPEVAGLVDFQGRKVGRSPTKREPALAGSAAILNSAPVMRRRTFCSSVDAVLDASHDDGQPWLAGVRDDHSRSVRAAEEDSASKVQPPRPHATRKFRRSIMFELRMRRHLASQRGNSRGEA